MFENTEGPGQSKMYNPEKLAT